MFLANYRFAGDPAALQAAYERMLAMMPMGNMPLHVCTRREDGLDIYDACPTRAAFENFAASPGFRGALESAGLPMPEIRAVGETHSLIVEGKRVF